MKMHKTLFFCLLAIVCSACSSRPSYVPTPTATITQSGPTRRPIINPDTDATQANAVSEASQITWSGSISPSVFKQLMSQRSENREAFNVPKSQEVFNLITRPIIVAAYVYNVPSDEQRHARFLLYEPGGKWKDEIVSPFLYKMDFPLSWIGGHEDFGNYDNLIRDLEAQFEHPILPNKLMVAVFAENHCTDAKDVYLKLCTELDRQDIELPVDYDAAKSMVMDQLNIAIQRTSETEDVEQVIKQVNAAGTDWWTDDRFELFYLPYVRVCLPGTPPVCGTYISYEIRIDAFGLMRATETTPALTSEFVSEPYVIVETAMSIRNGPGFEFNVIGEIESQKKYPVIGKHVDWWFLDLGNNRSGWIYTSINNTNFFGNMDAVPDLASPPTPTSEIIPACSPASGTEEPSEGLQKARNVLTTFFEVLNQREYEKAIALYGGDYQGLRDSNPFVDPTDYTTLLTHGCEMNGLQCLKVKRIVNEKVVSPAEYHFIVEFLNQDGSLFVRGPCCGGNATDFPPESQFAYTVTRNCAGEFLVLELPVYVP
jgi:hypothetical protein